MKWNIYKIMDKSAINISWAVAESMKTKVIYEK